MTAPIVKGWIHHYIFKDYYLRDSRTVLMESEIRYLEKHHGPQVVHWISPLMAGTDMIVCQDDTEDQDSSGGEMP